MEAYAHAVPVIASDIPAIRETVTYGLNGILCDPHRSDTFIEAMADIAQRPERALKMGLNGKKLVTEHYTWDKIAQETIATYQKMAS